MRETTAAGILLGFILFAMANGGEEDTPDETDEVVAACYDQSGEVKMIDYQAVCPEDYPSRVNLLSDNWQPDMPDPPEPPDLSGTLHDHYLVSQTADFPVGWKGNSIVTRDCRKEPGAAFTGDAITGGGYRLIPPTGRGIEWQEDPPIEVTSSRLREVGVVNGMAVQEWVVSIHVNKPTKEQFGLEVYAVCAKIK